MLRDFRSALILAALTGTLYALGIYLSPLRSIVGDGAWNLLVLLGIVLSATGFVVEFVASRLSRRLREGGTAFDDRLDAIAREKVMRLNAYLPTSADCSSSSDGREGTSGSTAQVVPFPALAQRTRRRRSPCLPPVAADKSAAPGQIVKPMSPDVFAWGSRGSARASSQPLP